MTPPPGSSGVDDPHREIQRLQQAVKRLSALNELARAIGAAQDMEEIMQVLVRRTLRMVGAAQGVINLVHEEAAASTAPMPAQPMETLVRTNFSSSPREALRPDDLILGWMLYHKQPLMVNDPLHDARFQETSWDPSIRSMLCVPLMVRSRLIGILSVYNKFGDKGFTQEDARLLTIIATQSAQVIESAHLLEERNRVVQVFGQHVSPAIVEALLKAGMEVTSRRQFACIMFVDIRGFTTFAEKRPPEDVVDYLNAVFGFMIDCVTQHHGIVHRMLGDGFVALFGAPLSRGNDCQHAVEAGWAILKQLEAEVAAGRIPPTRIGLGIHAGEVVAGTIGSSTRKEYQVNGDVVNLAARIEQMNKELSSQFLISETVWKALDPGRYEAQSLGSLEVRGRAGTVHVYRLA